jgi:hypothetical protein
LNEKLFTIWLTEAPQATARTPVKVRSGKTLRKECKGLFVMASFPLIEPLPLLGNHFPTVTRGIGNACPGMSRNCPANWQIEFFGTSNYWTSLV